MGSLMSGLGWHVFHPFPSRRQCSHLTAHQSATEDQRTRCPLGPAARSMAGHNIQQGRHTAGWIRIRKYVQRWAEIIRSCKDLLKIQVNRPACFCLELNVETSTTLSHPCFQQTVVKIQQTAQIRNAQCFDIVCDLIDVTCHTVEDITKYTSVALFVTTLPVFNHQPFYFSSFLKFLCQ